MEMAEEIPAFSMWKTLIETLPVIINMESSDQNFNRFKNLVLSPEFLEMFICSPNASMPFERYWELCGKYKAFTVSLLGRFFYLLSQEKLSRIHELLIYTQKRILEGILTTECSIYHKLTQEYVSVMKQLNDYMKDNYKGKVTLKAFIPEEHEDLKDVLNTTPTFIEITDEKSCVQMQYITLKFIDDIVVDKLKVGHEGDDVYEILDHLLSVLKKSEVDLKLKILETYTRILAVFDLPVEILNYLDDIHSIFKQVLHKCLLSKDRVGKILVIAKDILSCDKIKNKMEICEFILTCVYTKKLYISDTLFLFFFKGVGEDFCVPCFNLETFVYNSKTVENKLINHVRLHSRKNEQVDVRFHEMLLPLYNELNDEFQKDLTRFDIIKTFLKTCIGIKYRIYKSTKICVELLKETEFFPMLITCLSNDIQPCQTEMNMGMISKILCYQQILCGTINTVQYFHIIAYPYLTKFVFQDGVIPVSYSGHIDEFGIEKKFQTWYSICAKHSISHFPLQHTQNFFNALCLNSHTNFDAMEDSFLKIFNGVVKMKDAELLEIIIHTIPSILVNTKKVEERLDSLVIPLLKSPRDWVVIRCSAILQDVLVILLTDHSVVHDHGYSYDCQPKIKVVPKNGIITEDDVVIKQCKRKLDNLGAGSKMADLIKAIFSLFNAEEVGIRENALKTLPILSKYVLLFHHVQINKWMKLAEDESVQIRKSFGEILIDILDFTHNNFELKKEVKEKIISTVFTLLKNSVKESIKSKYDLQETLVVTIENLCDVAEEAVPLHVIKLVLFYVMLPTSRHKLFAISILTTLSRSQSTTIAKLYSKYRRELFEPIVHLCAINQALVDHNIATSLEKVSLMFGFLGSKHFVVDETRHLLPYLVALIVKMPAVKVLIEEIAAMNEVDLSELLQSKYGYIFLHIFLKDDNADNKKCMEYVESGAGLDGTSLRKRNFMIILNELLLNFHDKRERVLVALDHLAREDSEAPSTIPDFLQPKFLGVLQYFDLKLIRPYFDKEKVLLSLAQILKFMGPKHISPLRFKIIAMLRSALNLNTGTCAELNCYLWEAFVQSCDIELLGPQLATIFVSILPLRKTNSTKINNIFKYLIVDNESALKDNIPDLFFALEFHDLDYQILDVIREQLKGIQEEKSFKEHLKYFMKYLSYETVEVKIYALKYVKRLLEKNRLEVDQLVLGYNGIDGFIVELIDVLTLGCREQDAELRLACGECIGELAAIEPSHLPRTCTQEQYSFNFFIHEPAFIVSTLNELIRALQAVKNTQNMDRFALAIQETLKTYDISPDTSSNMHVLWNLFSEAHQELMLPLLSSKYTMAQGVETITVSPIYGSNFGATFQTWLYSWTVSLISTIQSDKKNTLQVCLPSMKQDHRTLMHFLPYILLHALTEGSQNVQQQIYNEFSVVLDFQNNSSLSESILDVRPIRAENFTSFDQTSTQESHKYEEYTKVMFVLLDFLDRWLREWLWDKGYSGRDNEMYRKIKVFLSRFCKLQVAKCNFACSEYPRALMYLEDYMAENKTNSNDNLSFLAEIYYRLDEPDGVAGVTALRQNEPSLEQKILGLKVSGKLSDVTACYERLTLPLNLNHIQGLINCYLDLDNVNTALNFARGTIEKQPEYKYWMLEAQAEPLWRLGRYDELDSLLKRKDLKDNNSWGVQIGRSLLAFKNGNRDDFKTHLTSLKLLQVNTLGAASLEEGAYQHGYYYISRLHALNELEQVEKMVYELLLRPNDTNACTRIVNKLKMEWELRLKVVQQSMRITEPILCLRRVAIEQAKNVIRERVPSSVELFDMVLGDSWLRSVENARVTEVYQQAYTYILKAEEYSPRTLFLEKAKLHWIREEYEQALTTLKRGLSKFVPEATTINSPMHNLPIEEKKICAEAKLLIASYNDSISNVDTDMNIQHYREAVEMFRQWEKSLVCLAQYYDRIFQNFSDEEKDVKGTDIQIHMINCFGKSLQYGTTYVYQSMPRLLSIWFDYGTRVLSVTVIKVKEERKNNLLKMTKLIDTFLERLPSYIFLTAFSQLVSRISHPQKEVYMELKSIFIHLIVKYPQQTLWMMISVIKSSCSLRTKRCAEIFNDGKLKNPTMVKFIADFKKLAEKLIELCNKRISDDVNQVSVNSVLRSLPRMLTKEDFSEIMIPTQMFRKLVLPNPDFSNSQHNPFPNKYVHIVGIEDEMSLLQSLQRPRKITLRGSDGKGYIQMLKPKDDLRKDFRLMEFNDIVNQLLSRDAESRQRRLNIRLYSVAPLNEECGLIEWVGNLVGLRPVLMTLYKQRGLSMKSRELKEACCRQTDSLETKRQIFLNKLLPKHPPILGDWFRKTFPDAQGWLTARTAYIHTTAVISMVGYILGLGDRHGENIQLDSTSGDTVHVDFNCLFNKGEHFDWPERVPFRLTQNMVAAMGPLGVEGVFRKSCACTLRVLRTHMNTLMSIVTPFVYDPLVSWPRNAQGTSNNLQSERTNESAVDNIKEIQYRLKGQVRTKSRTYSIPLSVEGQANFLISEAVSLDNLCQMYIGWGPYL